MRYAQCCKRLLEKLADVPILQAVPPGEAQQALSRVLDELVLSIGSLADGESLALQGFGKFQWKVQPERTHWNMASKQMETIPSKRVLVFEPSEAMKRKIP